MDTATSNAADEFVDVTDGPESLTEASGLPTNDATDHLSIGNGGASARQPKKKVNPLVDLIETEKAYVDLLAAIIRKVAAAWSRSNFPPPELDAMFRSVEVVYRANRTLLSKLNEIGPKPGSPKALGDLLMRWIDDLEAPYTRYCDGYTTSFDTWGPVQSNPNLRPILEEISINTSPSAYATNLDPTWTLDTLFLMPATRLKYYKKLYARLLKSTQPGRSDHKLLLGANERLGRLLSTVEERASIRVGADVDHGPVDPPASIEAAISPPPRKSSAAPGTTPSPAPSRAMSPHRSATPSPQPGALSSLPRSQREALSGPPPGRESTTGSSSSGRDSRHTEERESRGSVPTSTTSALRESTSTMSAPIVDLERRLSTERVIDIFTMTPRKCRLQMSPPNLTFTRRVRFSADVAINFTPRSTAVEVHHLNAHIFLLTDLFLICERMSEEERRMPGNDAADMWLLYPPLSAKHLIALDLDGPSDNVFQIQIMKKEVLIVRTESRMAKEAMLRDFRESYEDIMSIPGKSRSPPATGEPPTKFMPLGNGSVPRRSSTQGPEHRQYPLNRDNPHGMEPPRPQFGRLAAGSEPHLPLGPSGKTEQSTYTPPPRGTSRGATPSLIRANSSDNFAPNGFDGAKPPPQRTGSTQIAVPSGETLQRRPSDPHVLPALPPSPLPPFPRNMSQGLAPNSRAPPFTDTQHSPFPGNGYHPPPPPPPPPLGNHFEPGPGGYPMPPEDGLRSGVPSVRSFDTSSSQSRQLSLALSLGPRSGPRINTNVGGQTNGPEFDSPPSSPDGDLRPVGPVTSVITAQMKCKVFLKQQHAQWKALGSAKLLLYQQNPGNVKQLVVEADTKAKSLIISTIVLMDAVERVGRTGVAIELSDEGQRTGIVYMIQLKSEASATGFFTTLLAGSDRAVVHS